MCELQLSPLTPARNVVLVHGLYADGSCWLKVIPLLQQAGLNVAAVQNPLRSLTANCKFTRRTLALQDSPTVLVAHSYGGEVITQTGVDPKVSALVHCSARAPDANEDYAAVAKTYPAPPASAGLVTPTRPSSAISPAASTQLRRAHCTQFRAGPLRPSSPTASRKRLGAANPAFIRSQLRTVRSTLTLNASWRSA
jgi:pimeloyl-ACP methyl ester carboxylesterase